MMNALVMLAEQQMEAKALVAYKADQSASRSDQSPSKRDSKGSSGTSDDVRTARAYERAYERSIAIDNDRYGRFSRRGMNCCGSL